MLNLSLRSKKGKEGRQAAKEEVQFLHRKKGATSRFDLSRTKGGTARQLLTGGKERGGEEDLNNRGGLSSSGAKEGQKRRAFRTARVILLEYFFGGKDSSTSEVRPRGGEEGKSRLVGERSTFGGQNQGDFY